MQSSILAGPPRCDCLLRRCHQHDQLFGERSHLPRCAVIHPDSVLDFDDASGRTATRSVDTILAHIRSHVLTLDWLIETHVHADHLSAAPSIQRALGGKIGIGDRITDVQNTFGKVLNEGTEFERDGDTVTRGGTGVPLPRRRALAVRLRFHIPDLRLRDPALSPIRIAT